MTSGPGPKYRYRVTVRCPACGGVVGFQYLHGDPWSFTHQQVQLADGRWCTNRDCRAELRWPDGSVMRAAIKKAQQKPLQLGAAGSGKTASVRAVRVR